MIALLLALGSSLMVELLLWPVLGASFGVAALAWGAASGVASAAAFVLLPAGTVLLARGVLAERIHRGRLAGPGTAAVSLLALS
ncbi:hypothetical protein GCM10010313_05640 [Streptomyces violarus]|uniref:Uncharacterized protein n=1 Tax=Streptomyces violarus TaxID=67380 RepID=A0A7W4ZKC6_9ACTN|nr:MULTISPECIES: hypothetical protein [Streptomyces]MBB3074098.1 hypothetical protein [Streptomyces violarus]WRT96823.1 hypothetical protein VJ737_03565 [Streptomyces sp. CGMCC 4.1772]GHC97764.1 hypothetical protein GCM10010313_05640 [Streptomyces violarus]